MNSEHKAPVKMFELYLITSVGISESWDAFDELRFNISFSVFGFEILLNLECLFVLLLFITVILGWLLYSSIDLVIGSSIWLIFIDFWRDISEYLDLKLHR